LLSLRQNAFLCNDFFPSLLRSPHNHIANVDFLPRLDQWFLAASIKPVALVSCILLRSVKACLVVDVASLLGRVWYGKSSFFLCESFYFCFSSATFWA
jgi:hypothetical protein